MTFRFSVLGLCFLAAGCVGVALEGAAIGKDEIVYNNNIEKAKQGDAEAQFKVGDSLCCSPAEKKGPFYDTKRAVQWLCASAQQDYGPAMYKIGKIFSGDTVDGVRLLRRVAMGIGDTQENRAIAYAWTQRAANRRVPDADDRAEDLWEDLDASERNRARAYLDGLRPLSCVWEEVFPDEQK